MNIGLAAFVAPIVLLAALATSCIDATTVYVVPDPAPAGDDDGASGDAGSPFEDGPVDASSNDAPPDAGSVDGPLE